MTTAACLQVAEEDYGQLVDRENINREQDGVDASGMEAAIAALVIGDSTPEDRHPEKWVLKCCRAHEGPLHMHVISQRSSDTAHLPCDVSKIYI